MLLAGDGKRGTRRPRRQGRNLHIERRRLLRQGPLRRRQNLRRWCRRLGGTTGQGEAQRKKRGT